jgi:hypothetical protein
MSRRLEPLFTWRSAICDSSLPPTARLVAFAISFYMNERGGSCHPGPTRLARDTGLSLRAVKKHLVDLEDTGWLLVVDRGGQTGERRRANSYEARIPDPPDNPGPVHDLHRTISPDRPGPVHEMHPCHAADDTDPSASFPQPVHQVHPPTPPANPGPVHELHPSPTRDHPQPVHDVHPCTTFTRAPENPNPCTSLPQPVHQVHPNSSKNSSRTHQGRARERGAPENELRAIADAYAELYREHHNDNPPPTAWTRTLARSLAELSDDGATPAELEHVIGVLARTGKHPRNAVYVLGDHRRQPPTRPARLEPRPTLGCPACEAGWIEQADGNVARCDCTQLEATAS